MTNKEAIEHLQAFQLVCDDYTYKAIDVILKENIELDSKLNDRLPNGGMVSHEAKHSMQPTLKHDTE